jgi:hypothetical protein
MAPRHGSFGRHKLILARSWGKPGTDAPVSQRRLACALFRSAILNSTTQVPPFGPKIMIRLFAYGFHSPPGRDGSKVRLIPHTSTCPAAWRCLMRHVSLHPSSFALPPWLRPRSNGHKRMPRQNRLRPSPRSRRKICRRAMGKEGGESLDHLVGEREPLIRHVEGERGQFLSRWERLRRAPCLTCTAKLLAQS